MIAICPNNTSHKEFGTTAHVTQDWKVDEEGNFLESINDCLEVTRGPNVENTWTCYTCGAEAVVKE